MTSSDVPRSTAEAAPSVLSVRDQGELVAAVPVLLGFRPRESLVLLATGGDSGRRIGLTLRIDLPPPECGPAKARGVVDAAVRGLLLDSPTGAAVIVVSSGGGADPPYRELVDLAVETLEGHRIEVHTVVSAEGTIGGARWRCYDPCGCRGTVPDPASTALTAAAVVGGQVVHAGREELERLVAPADSRRLRRREELLIQAIDDAASAPTDRPERLATEQVVAAVVDPAIAAAAGGRLVLDDTRVLDLALALADPAVRDVAMLRCTGPDAAAAEQLWTALVRETPDPEAAEPATLLAVSALLRGDGALANVALDRAEQAWPGHRFTGLLREVTAAGASPSRVRSCLLRGAEVGGAEPAAASRRPRRARRRVGSRWRR